MSHLYQVVEMLLEMVVTQTDTKGKTMSSIGYEVVLLGERSTGELVEKYGNAFWYDIHRYSGPLEKILPLTLEK